MSNNYQQNKLDIRYMKRALHLAKKGQGSVSPNPLVGAIVVKDGHVIGEGYHQKYGESHAEINAINAAGLFVKDATLYSTLEPCCHSDKQTPPCVNHIIEKGFSRVVIASNDPNPLVNGKGLKLLQDAGVEVTRGVLDEENQDLNKFYFKYIRTGLPYITLKVAQTIDGYMTDDKNQQLWLTGERSKRLVHHWRSIYDAVLIGANTLRIDNPLLTVRYGKKRNPIRIIITGSNQIDPELKVFKQSQRDKTWLITTKKNHQNLVEVLGNTGCELIGLPVETSQRVPLLSLLEYLGDQKISSIMVEGGQEILSQFLETRLWDELNIFIAPKLLGAGYKSFGSNVINQLSSFHLHYTTKIGNDVLLNYLPHR